MWVPSETKDPVLKHHPTRKGVGYFGAVRLRDGYFAYRKEADKFNGQTFADFLSYLEEKSRLEGRKVMVISDNAKYHHAKMHKEWRQGKEPAFVILYLPPYSPDLNPIERVWKLTRRLCMHNRYFDSLQCVVDAVEACFQRWTEPNDDLRRLCSIAKMTD